MPRQISYAEAKGRVDRPRRPGRGMYKGSQFARFDTFGVPELDRLFKRLSDSQRRSIIVSAWRKASKPMLAEVKGNARSMVGRVTGNLFKSHGVSPVKDRAELRLGARRFAPWAGFHAHLVNDGTANRYTASGEFRGRVRETHYFDIAIEATKQQVVDDFRNGRIEVFHKFIERANKRARKR